jgi:hypothetical protein
MCFVVLGGRIATDIPRAKLNKNKNLKISEFPISTALRATNQLIRGQTCGARQNQSMFAQEKQTNPDYGGARR